MSRASIAELDARLDAMAGGRPDEALALLEPLVVERPLDEDVQRLLLVALAATGRRWDGPISHLPRIFNARFSRA